MRGRGAGSDAGRRPRSGLLRAAGPAGVVASGGGGAAEPLCPTKTWTEHSEHVDAQVVLTRRAGVEACRQVGENARPVSPGGRRARGVLVDDHERRHRARHPAGRRPRPDRPGPPARASTRRRSWPPTADHATVYATGLVDLERHVVIDMVEGNSAADLRRWTDQRRPRLAGRDRGGGHRSGRVVPGRAVARIWITPAGSPTRSTSCGSATAASTRSAAGSRTRPSAIEAARAIRCIGSASCCSPAPNASTNGAAIGCCSACASVTPTTRCSAPGWPRSRSATSTSPTPRPTPRTLLDKAIAGCLADDVAEIRSLGKTLASWRTEILAHHDHRRHQRTDRGPQPVRQEGQALRPRLPNLRALPAPRPAPRRRHHLASTTPTAHASEPALPTHSRRARLAQARSSPATPTDELRVVSRAVRPLRPARNGRICIAWAVGAGRDYRVGCESAPSRRSTLNSTGARRAF